MTVNDWCEPSCALSELRRQDWEGQAVMVQGQLHKAKRQIEKLKTELAHYETEEEIEELLR